jgi:hypothetical protein
MIANSKGASGGADINIPSLEEIKKMTLAAGGKASTRDCSINPSSCSKVRLMSQRQNTPTRSTI